MRLDELARLFDDARKAFGQAGGGLGVSHSMGYGSVVRLPKVLGLAEDGYGNAIPGMENWIRQAQVEPARRGGYRIVLTTRNFWLAREIPGSWRSGSRKQFVSAAAYGYADEAKAREDVERVAALFWQQDVAEDRERAGRKEARRAAREDQIRQELLAKKTAEQALERLCQDVASEARRRGLRVSTSPSNVCVWSDEFQWLTGTPKGDGFRWTRHDHETKRQVETPAPLWVEGFLRSRKS